MPVVYDYDPVENIVHAWCDGYLSIAEIDHYFSDVGADDRIKSGVTEFIHLETVENFDFPSQTAAEIPRRFDKTRRIKQIETSILIAPGDLQFGLARMVQAFFENHLPEHGYFVVRSRSEAEGIKRARDRGETI